MGQIKINELKYLVMEGGGARGTAYLGAIRGLEAKFAELVKSDPDNYKVRNYDQGREGGPGILDFQEKQEDGSYRPIIKGAAGGSAGAITTFAILLGLNAREIEVVLNFEFKNFLSEIHHGSYRMVGADSMLKIGRDKKELVDVGLDIEKIPELGGDPLPFEFSFKEDKTKVKSNLIKAAKGRLIIHAVIKIIGDGIASNIKTITELFKLDSLSENLKNEMTGSGLGKFLENKYAQFASSNGLYMIIYGFLFKKLRKMTSMKINVESLTAVGSDRGIFSGFQVREFFYDLLLYASTRDTFFQEQMLKYFRGKTIAIPDEIPISIGVDIKSTFSKYTNYSGKAPVAPEPDPVSGIVDPEALQEYFEKMKITNYLNKFEIGNRSAVLSELDDKEIIGIFKHLQHLTFRELWEITDGIPLAIGSSNFTFGKPLYFSDLFTPHYRVLEAVSSSMNIPPIKPLFTEADVFIPEVLTILVPETQNDEALRVNKHYGHLIPQYFGSEDKRKVDFSVNVGGQDEPFVTKGNFKAHEYHLYETAVKKYLIKSLEGKDGTEKVYLDINNGIDLNTSLPELMKYVIGEKYKRIITENQPNSYTVNQNRDALHIDESVNTVEVSNKEIVVDEKLLTFMYNAQYKGMLIDAGYYNNIPYNFFRDCLYLEDLQGVLAIKLDNNFPDEFIEDIRPIFEKHLTDETSIRKRVEDELYSSYWTGTTKKIEIDKKFELLVDEIVQLLYKELHTSLNNNDLSDKKRLPFKLQREAALKVIEQLLDDYREMEIKPWAQSKSIAGALTGGFLFGAERGQIRKITDHNHIIPLYDYGVGTYDFDMAKIVPLAKMAQDKAEEKIDKFVTFKKPKPAED